VAAVPEKKETKIPDYGGKWPLHVNRLAILTLHRQWVKLISSYFLSCCKLAGSTFNADGGLKLQADQHRS
jgi:hypothetical protein